MRQTINLTDRQVSGRWNKRWTESNREKMKVREEIKLIEEIGKTVVVVEKKIL